MSHRNYLHTSFTLFLFSISIFAQAQTCEQINEQMQSFTRQGRYDLACELVDKCFEVCSDSGMVHEHYITALNNRAVCQAHDGDFEGGLHSLDEVITIMLQLHGSDSSYAELAAVYTSKAYCFMQLSRWEKALNAIDEALRISLVNHQTDSLDYIIRLNTKAQIFIMSSQYPLAMPVLDEALQKSLNVREQDPFPWINSAASKVVLLGYIGAYAEAKTLATEVIAIIRLKFGKENQPYVQMNSSLSLICQNLNQLEEAAARAEEAIRYGRQVFPPTHLEFIRLLGNTGKIYKDLGQFAKARTVFLEALPGAEATGAGSIVYVQANSNLAASYLDSGILDSALIYSEKAYRAVLDSFPTPYIQLFLSLSANMGDIYSSLGFCLEAEQVYQKGILVADSLLGKNHPDNLHLVNQLALLYARSGKTDSARMLIRETIARMEASLDKKHFSLAGAYQTLAFIDEKEGLYKRAALNFEKALSKMETMLHERHPAAIPILVNYGINCVKRGQLTRARDLFKQANDIYDQLPPGTIVDPAALFYNYAGVLEQIGDMRKAFSLLQKADSFNREKLMRHFSVLSSRGREVYLNILSGDFERMRAFAWRQRQKVPEAQINALQNDMLISGLLQRSSESIRRDILQSGDTLILQQFDTWMACQARVNREITLADSLRKLSPAQIDSLQDLAEAIERYLLAQSVGFRAAFASVSFSALQQTLAPNEIAIQFTHFSESNNWDKPDSIWLAAIIAQKNAPHPVMVRLCRQQKILGIPPPRTPEEYKKMYALEAPQSLYQLIWKPIEPFLDSINTIFYVPDGLLHQIAFPAIEIRPGEILIDHFELISLSSMTDLVDGYDLQAAAIKNALIIGGLDYDSMALSLSYSGQRSDLQYLPFSMMEIDSCELILRQALVFLMTCRGNQAPERLIRAMGSRWLSPHLFHAAVHGKSDGNNWANPQEPCETPHAEDPLNQVRLYLSGSDPLLAKSSMRLSDEDQVLFGSEIATLNLSNTKIAILSACETGKGDIRGMEGVYSLQRAFRLAGVDHLIYSLWSVHDKSGAEFMITLYRHWFEQGSLRAAFLQTQRDLRRKYSQEGPYFWAMFGLN